MSIRSATSHEAPALGDLAFRSKAYWGYSDEFMAACKDDLQVTPEDCDAGLVHVATDGDTITGYYRISGEDQQGKLDDLFVDPDYIGRGVGKELLTEAITHARALGYAALEIHSDPNAEAFYLHMGALRIGAIPSGSIADRELSLLTLPIA